MNSSYNNRSKKNKKIPEDNNHPKAKRLFPLGHYINNGLKLNSYSGSNKVEIKNKVLNEKSNPLVNRYNPPDSYNQNYKQYKSNNIVNFNNHSLFDSNKQKIINPQNNNNYVEFISNKKSINANSNNNNNKLPLCTLRNYQLSINRLKYIDGYFKNINYDDSRKLKINYSSNNNTRNNTLHKNHQNYYTKISQTNFNYNINNKILNKSLNFNKNNNSNYIKNPPSEHRNKNYNLSNNFTEKKIKCICTPTPSQSKDKNEGKKYYKRNKTDNKHLTENNSQDKKIKKYINTNIRYNLNKKNNINNDTHSPSFFKTKNYNSPDILNKKRRHIIKDNNNINKTSRNIKEDNLRSIMPIKLNIEYTTKEKLSRLKRIIEQSSTNHNFYQIEFPKNLQNENIKSTDRNNKNMYDIEENNKKPIFKKKKIEILNKENKENKEEKKNNKYYENNFLVTSPINIKTKNEKRISNNKIKDNNQIQSMVASYNLYMEKENNNNKIKKNSENKISTKETEQTSYLYTNKDKIFKKKKTYKKNIELNNNNEDTISLSYSKERNLSISSGEKKNEEISISLPFLVENFNVQYNIYNKKLIIDEKNKMEYNNKKSNINNDSEDDDYQLTKEIILLKKGLSKKNELNNIIKKKLREIIPERNYKLTLFGNKKLYRKKMKIYKNHKL